MGKTAVRGNDRFVEIGLALLAFTFLFVLFAFAARYAIPLIPSLFPASQLPLP